MGSVDSVKAWSAGSFASISVYRPTFDGTPQNVLVNVSVCRSQKALFPSEARELAKALEEAASAAKEEQKEYDKKLEDKVRSDEAGRILDSTGGPKSSCPNIRPIVDLLAERDSLKAELNRRKKGWEIKETCSTLEGMCCDIKWDVEKEEVISSNEDKPVEFTESKKADIDCRLMLLEEVQRNLEDRLDALEKWREASHGKPHAESKCTVPFGIEHG